MNAVIVAIPFVTAAIGYGTNWMAIRMIYHPARRIGLGPIGWQGIVHRLSDKLARELASTITAVIAPHEIVDRIKTRDLLTALDQHDAHAIDEILEALVEHVAPGRWSDLDIEHRTHVRTRFLAAASDLDQHLRDTLLDHADELLDIEELTVELLSGPNSARLAELSRDLGARELRFIEAYGAVFGFGIGLAQVGVYQLLSQWWLLPVVGALVGAATNYLALAMIFRPLEPTRYLGLVTYQGMFPRRQPEIAAQFAAVTANELLTARQIIERVSSAPAAPAVVQAALLALNHQLPGILEPALGRAPDPGEVANAALGLTRLPATLPAGTTDQLLAALDSHVDLERLMHERLATMPKQQFERLLHGMFEEDEGILIVIGGVLGAAAGIAQVILL